MRRFSGPFDRKNAFIGKVPHVASLRNTIVKLKDLEAPVCISGEDGVGKSLYAHILHAEGQRGLKKIEKIDCSDKDHSKLEKELFGPNPEDCKLITCQGGTVELHEICYLPLAFQKRLLAVLTEKHLDNTKFSVDVRVVSTTTKDLAGMVQSGEFSKELFEYISKAPVHIEPLRRRLDDMELLVDYFLKIECKKQGLLLKSFSTKTIEKMKKHDWPGNVRELQKCIERAVLYNPKAHIISDIELTNSASPLVDVTAKKRMFGDLPYVSDHTIPLKDRVALIEREMIHAEIRRNNGNKSKSAKEMGMSREALRKKLLMSSEVLKNLNLTEEEKLKIRQEDEEFLNAA